MAYNFPNSPSNGDTVTVNNVTYTYDSTLGVWSTAVVAPIEPAITSDGATPSLNSGITAIEVKTLLGVPTDISNVIDGAPSTLNTLNKLAAAINDDASFHTSVAPLVSPAFTGAPTSPTATTGTNTTQIATTEFVQTEISGFTTLTGLSVTSNSASGNGALTYNNTTGVFTYTPPSLAFSNISSTPTTIAGYGITDAFDGAFSSLTGVPTTISGYGITDAFDGVFASLTAKPTTIAGYGITDAFDGAFSSLTGVPTTISGYGITDAFDGAFSSLTGVPTTISGYGITDAFDGAFSSLTGVPTTVSGYGITDTYTTGAHLIPTANETYDLGSSSNKFRDLYLSGTSIHLGSQEITSDTGGVVVSALKIGSGANQVTLSASNGELQSGSNSYLIAGSDLDLGSNDITTTGRIYFANMFSQTSDLPSASTYHGMFAHVHSAGAAYFAHGGNWVELANKSYVDTEVAALVNSAPATLDTLDELAAALNDDANFATTVTTSLSQKAPLQNPALTGTPTAPTAGPGTNNTQIATTAYVDTAVAGASGTYSDASVDTHLNTGTASTNEVLSWNGSDYDWVAQATGGGGASVSTSDAPPSSPSAGDLWYNTDAGGLFVYYTDADSSQWVEVVGKTGATGATGATGPAGGGATTFPGLTDTPASLGTAGQIVAVNSGGTALEFINQTAGTTTFTGLTDTPNSFGTAGQILVVNSGGTALEFAAPVVDTAPFVKAYRYDDTLTTNTGSKRLYLEKAYTLNSIKAYVDTAPVGAAINLDIKKNGTSLQTVSIADGASTGSQTSLTHSIAADDYLTIDITQVGSSTAGENLYLVFTFN